MVVLNIHEPFSMSFFTPDPPDEEMGTMKKPASKMQKTAKSLKRPAASPGKLKKKSAEHTGEDDEKIEPTGKNRRRMESREETRQKTTQKAQEKNQRTKRSLERARRKKTRSKARKTNGQKRPRTYRFPRKVGKNRKSSRLTSTSKN